MAGAAGMLHAVIMWPPDAADLASITTKNILVIGIETAPTSERTFARRQIRVAISEALGIVMGRDGTQLSITSNPGQPLQVADTAIGLSIAHEAGMSIAVINLRGSVGVDIVRLDALAPITGEVGDWQQLASDYLGPAALQRIRQRPSALRNRHFAIEWAAQEARLKYLGQGLIEWTAAPAETSHLIAHPLALPPQWIGMLATAL